MQKCAMQVCKHTDDAFNLKELRYHSSLTDAMMTAELSFVLNVSVLFLVAVYFKF